MQVVDKALRFRHNLHFHAIKIIKANIFANCKFSFTSYIIVTQSAVAYEVREGGERKLSGFIMQIHEMKLAAISHIMQCNGRCGEIVRGNQIMKFEFAM